MNSALKHPLVSCIMPTRNRRKFLPYAIHHFLKQDYPHKELVIVDDGEDKIHDLIPESESIRYLCMDKVHTIGKKRNIAIRAGKGEVIIHWDDDDWFAYNRITLQIDSLLQENQDINGLDKLIFLDINKHQAWMYKYVHGSRSWLAGGSLCYRKEVWEDGHFDDLTYGEDTQWLWSKESSKCNSISDFTFYIAIIHSGNTIEKRIDPVYYEAFPLDVCRKILKDDFSCYLNIE